VVVQKVPRVTEEEEVLAVEGVKQGWTNAFVPEASIVAERATCESAPP
jgi:hypothetical protein